MKGKIYIENDGAGPKYSITFHFSFWVEIVHNYEHELSLLESDFKLYTFQKDGYPGGMEGYGNELPVQHSMKNHHQVEYRQTIFKLQMLKLPVW